MPAQNVARANLTIAETVLENLGLGTFACAGRPKKNEDHLEGTPPWLRARHAAHGAPESSSQEAER